MPVYGVVECCLCSRMFRCDIGRVFLLTILGSRRPVCRGCLEAGNRTRMRLGKPLLPVPIEAYEPQPS
jgi:hypothetical protein